MAENSAISWTDHTLNPWFGCTKVSPACAACYAEALMDTRYGRVKWGAPGAGVGTRVQAKAWRSQLHKFQRLAAEKRAQTGEATFVFCLSLGDVFDKEVPALWRRDLFNEVRQAPDCTMLFLTKRPSLIERLAEEAGGLPPNAAIGCTVVNQEEADRDIPALLLAKAKLKPAFAFLSMEPLLGHVDLTRLSTMRFPGAEVLNALTGELAGMFGEPGPTGLPGVDWVITGGETDQAPHKARPAHPDWFRSLRNQCAAAGVPYHHKQQGEWAPICWLADGQSARLYHPAPRRDPEAIRRCKVEHTVMNRDGSLHPSAADPETYHPEHGSMLMFKVGKKEAGRQIDGSEHNTRPEVAHG